MTNTVYNIHDTIGIKYLVNNVINIMRVYKIDGRVVIPAIDLPLMLAARGLFSLYNNIICCKS